ncbi:folylpolyglutamate synthase/dihydrofolate synthase family protein [Caldicellulosiruptoraceae bacterium PP1]
MNYEEALSYIHNTYKFGIKLGLENIKTLLNLLENPQEHLRIIHVAGTNGKGSTCAFINQIFIENGFKVGLYTSPYLEYFNERIKINNIPISNDELAFYTKKVKDKVDYMISSGFNHPTEFEIITALAFLYFKDKNVDFVVLEVGLGGRFDATNVINKPVISVITSISFDHQDKLGETIEEIAFEKAGIIKKNSTVILGKQKYPEAIDVIKRKAIELNAKFISSERVSIDIIENNTQNIIVDIKTDKNIYNNLKINMLGLHQIENIINAILVFETLQDKYNLNLKALYDGLKNTKWNGRFEILKREPFIIIDGAHNIDGIETLIQNVNIYFNRKNIIILFGVLKDKNYEIMIKKIEQLSNKIIYTEVPNNRTLNIEKYKELSKSKEAMFIKDYYQALKYLIENYYKEDNVLIVCGSLYLIGPIRTTLCKYFNLS